MQSQPLPQIAFDISSALKMMNTLGDRPHYHYYPLFAPTQYPHVYLSYVYLMLPTFVLSVPTAKVITMEKTRTSHLMTWSLCCNMTNMKGTKRHLVMQTHRLVLMKKEYHWEEVVSVHYQLMCC